MDWKIENKVHLSQAEAEIGAELGSVIISIYLFFSDFISLILCIIQFFKFELTTLITFLGIMASYIAEAVLAFAIIFLGSSITPSYHHDNINKFRVEMKPILGFVGACVGPYKGTTTEKEFTGEMQNPIIIKTNSTTDEEIKKLMEA